MTAHHVLEHLTRVQDAAQRLHERTHAHQDQLRIGRSRARCSARRQAGCAEGGGQAQRESAQKHHDRQRVEQSP